MNCGNVTLMMVDGGNDPEQTARTINHCADMLPWGAVVMLSCRMPRVRLNPKVEFSIIPHLDYPLGVETLRGSGGLVRYVVRTSHALFMQNDGYIIHPELWQDSWLGYDLIAPPWLTGNCWPEHVNRRVGSGGLQLKSAKFMNAVANVWRRGYAMDAVMCASDIWECRCIRGILEKDYGIVFAPVMEAVKFGVEAVGDEWAGWTDDKSFGFHDCKCPGANPGRTMVVLKEGDVIALEGETVEGMATNRRVG
jgi:hypothetical protein